MTHDTQPGPPLEVTVEVDGTTYTGRYDVQGGMVTVYSHLGRRSIALGSSPPHRLAENILREMARPGHPRRH